MLLRSQSTPVLLPDIEQDSVMQLGLQKLPLEQWLSDEDLAIFYAHKLQCARENKQAVYASLPGSEPAQEEFAGFLLQYFQDHRPDLYRKRTTGWQHQSGLSWQGSPANLWQAALMIAEDVCLLEKRADEYVLTAASVCSPSNWSVQDKIGKTVTQIHAPVPGYEEKLSQRVNRLLDKLPDRRGLLRFNWSLQSGNELYWQGQENMTAQNLQPFWRVERQTLLRLPISGAIVFAIRIFLYDIQSMPQQQVFRDKLNTLLARLPEQEIRYKGLLGKFWQ